MEPNFRQFTRTLVGLPVSHFWQGYGSAIFIEFGKLSPNGFRKNGSPCNLFGEWSLCVEWSWRIEGKRRIWCGSWSDQERWPRVFSRLLNTRVIPLTLNGRLPEIDIGFSNGLHLLSFATAKGDPE